jgi:hypothetical protein
LFRYTAHVAQRSLRLPDDDKAYCAVRSVHWHRPMLPHQLLGVALGHAGQALDKRDPLALEEDRRLSVARRGHRSTAGKSTCRIRFRALILVQRSPSVNVPSAQSRAGEKIPRPERVCPRQKEDTA